MACASAHWANLVRESDDDMNWEEVTMAQLVSPQEDASTLACFAFIDNLLSQ